MTRDFRKSVCLRYNNNKIGTMAKLVREISRFKVIYNMYK